MGNDSQPSLRLASQPPLDFHSLAQHPLHGQVSVYTCRSLPMTFLMRLDRHSAHSRLYHLFQQVQDLESAALLTLYGFHIQRTPHCATCPSRDLTTEYWEYLNYSLAHHLRDRHRRHAPLTPHEIWHIVQTVLEGCLILQRVGLIWEVNPQQLVVTPEGKLKCSWSHLQANNAHLRYFQALSEYFPDLKECVPIQPTDPQQDDSSEFLSPEEKWLLSEKERTSRINLEKCNSYKFGMLLVYAITLKPPLSPLSPHLLEHLYAEAEGKYPAKLLDILRGTLEVEPAKRWSLNMVESYCVEEFNPDYELLISEGRREELQEFNVEAQLKAENSKATRRMQQGSIHSVMQSGQLQSGGRVNSQQGRQVASTESSCDQRLLQLREYRRTMMRSRQH